MYDDETTIKIHHDYVKGHCMYNLTDQWNNADYDLKMAGNLWSLRTMIKSKMIDTIEAGSMKNCYNCNLDKNKNYKA